jgi:hypothetical protein
MNVVVHKTQSDTDKLELSLVPPEEFLIERRAKSIESANFVCHRA